MGCATVLSSTGRTGAADAERATECWSMTCSILGPQKRTGDAQEGKNGGAQGELHGNDEDVDNE